jgi:outer membrane protein assembly factor BamA
MAALPVYFLIAALAAPDSFPEAEYNWVEVVATQGSLIVSADSFDWERTAASLIMPAVDSGYAFAQLSLTASQLAGDTLILRTVIDKGPQVTVSSLAFSGEVKTKPGLLAHLVRFQPFVFSTDNVEELFQSFQAIDCTVADYELLTSDADSALTLHLLVNEKPSRNRGNVLLGYGDADGFLGMVDITLFNLFGGRREFFFTWQRFGASDVNFAASARDPYPFRLPFGVQAGGAFRSFDEATYHLEAWAGAFVNTASFEVGAGYAYEHDRSGSAHVSKNLAYTWLTAGSLRADIKAGERRADERSAYLSASARAGLLLPLLWGFSFYLEPNAALVASGEALLETELLPVGGARTLRGYSEEEFRTELGLWSRQELRWGSEVFSIYPLFDAAWIDGYGFLAGYGAGVTVATPIGQLELAAALPFDGSWTDAKLHLSLGAEF